MAKKKKKQDYNLLAQKIMESNPKKFKKKGYLLGAAAGLAGGVAGGVGLTGGTLAGLAAMKQEYGGDTMMRYNAGDTVVPANLTTPQTPTASSLPGTSSGGFFANLGDAKFGEALKSIGGRKTDAVVGSFQDVGGAFGSLLKGDLKGFGVGMYDAVKGLTQIGRGNRIEEKISQIQADNVMAAQDASADVNVNKYGEVIDPGSVENQDIRTVSASDAAEAVELGVTDESGSLINQGQLRKDLLTGELNQTINKARANVDANYASLMQPFQQIGKSAIDTGKQMANQFVQQNISGPLSGQVDQFASNIKGDLAANPDLQNFITNTQFGQGMVNNLMGGFGADHGGDIPNYDDGSKVKKGHHRVSWATPDQLDIMKTARQYLIEQGFGNDAYTQAYKNYLIEGGDEPVQASYKPSDDVLKEMSNYMASLYTPDQIKDFQNRLGYLTSTDKFQYKGGEEKDFGDGIFGPATASTYMDYHLGFLKRGLQGNVNMFDKVRDLPQTDYSQPITQMKQGEIPTEAEDTATVNLASGAVGKTFKKGGGVNNPGFMALPDNVQHKILKGMAEGGDLESMTEEERAEYCAANPDKCGAYNPLRVSGSIMGNTGNVDMSIPLSDRFKLNLGYNKGDTSETTGGAASIMFGGGTKGQSLGKNVYGGVNPFAYYRGTLGGILSNDEERTTRGTTSIEGGAGLGLRLGPRGGSSLNLYGSGGYRGGSGTPEFMKGPFVGGNLGITRTGPWGTRFEPKGGIEYNFDTKQFMPKFGVGISFEDGGEAKDLPNEGLEALNKVRPDIVSKMGYEQGGDAAQYQGDVPMQEDYVEVPEGYEGTFTIPGQNEKSGGTLMSTPAEGMGNEEIIVNESGPEVAEVAGGETFIYPHGKFSNEKKKLDKQAAVLKNKLNNARDEFEIATIKRMLENNDVAQADLKQRIKDERAKKEANAKTKIDELLTSNVNISDEGKYKQGGKVKMLNNLEKEALVNMYMGGELDQYAEGDEVRYRVKKENGVYKIYDSTGKRAIRNLYSKDQAILDKKLNNWLRSKGVVGGMSDKSVAGINNPFDAAFPVDETGKDQVVEEQIQENITAEGDTTGTNPFTELVNTQKQLATDIINNPDLNKEEKETELAKLDPFVMEEAKANDEEFATALQDFATVEIPEVEIAEDRLTEPVLPIDFDPNKPMSSGYVVPRPDEGMTAIDPNTAVMPPRDMSPEDRERERISRELAQIDLGPEIEEEEETVDDTPRPTVERMDTIPAGPLPTSDMGPDMTPREYMDMGPFEKKGRLKRWEKRAMREPDPEAEGLLTSLFDNLGKTTQDGMRGPGDDIAESALTRGIQEQEDITNRMMQATDKAPNVGDDLMKQSRFDYDLAMENLKLANRGIKADINANMGTRMRGAERFRSIQDQEAYKQNIANDAVVQGMKADSLLANAMADLQSKKANQEMTANVYSDKFALEQFDRDEAAKDAYFTALSQNAADATAAGLLMGKNRNDMLTNMLMAQNTGAGNYRYNPNTGMIEFVDPTNKKDEEEIVEEETIPTEEAEYGGSVGDMSRNYFWGALVSNLGGAAAGAGAGAAGAAGGAAGGGFMNLFQGGAGGAGASGGGFSNILQNLGGQGGGFNMMNLFGGGGGSQTQQPPVATSTEETENKGILHPEGKFRRGIRDGISSMFLGPFGPMINKQLQQAGFKHPLKHGGSVPHKKYKKKYKKK